MHRSVLALLAALAAPTQADAGPCDAHFPFDGNLADVSGNGYHGLPITKEGEPAAPRFADGRIGQALHVTGGNAMRAFIDLHHEFCPQVTVTAWFKLESVEASGNQYTFSPSGGNGPGVRAQGSMLAMNGAGNGIFQRDAIRDKDTWFFLAGVYDNEAKAYRLYWRNRVVEGKFGDSRRQPEDSFWVGTYNDSMSYTAQSLYIDDLRIHGKALTAEEIRAVAADTDGRAAAESTGANLGSLSAEQLTELARNSGGSRFSRDLVASLPACEKHEDCATGSYCAFDNTCHPDRHLPKQDLKLAVIQADPAPGGFILPELPDESEDEESPAYEQMPAPTITAVMDLERFRIRRQHENRGDEYYLVTYALRGRRGEGPRVYTFDYSERVWPLGAGDNWAEADRTYTFPVGAGRFVFNNLKPFEMYGFVAVLMEANSNSVEERTNAFGFGEFQNESGVTEVIGGAFERAVPAQTQAPAYSDTSCSNVTKIFFDNIDGLTRHFGDFRQRNSGLSSAIQDAIEEPLRRNNPDLFDGAVWSFYMNVPGEDRCISYPTEGPVYATPGVELRMDTFSTTIYGTHSQ